MVWYKPSTWGNEASPETQTRMIDSFGGFELSVNGGFRGEPSALWAYRGALEIPGVWRAANLIADTISALPQKAYRTRGGNPIEEVHFPILDQPSFPHTRIETWSSMLLDLVMNGNALALIATRDSAGTPTALIPLPAFQTNIRRRYDGTLEYAYRGETYEANEILHIRGPHQPGDYRGYGVLEAHFRTIGLAHELTEQAQDISKGVPSGVLKSSNPDLTPAEAADLKTQWLTSQRKRTVAVLNASTEFQALAWNPTDAQVLETRKFSLVELALIFGVPPHFLAAENGSGTYTNVQQEALSLVKYSLQGHISRIEQALSQLLPNGTTVELSLDALLRADTLTRYQAHSLALTSRWKTPNEVRADEGLPPIDGGDKLYIPEAIRYSGQMAPSPDSAVPIADPKPPAPAPIPTPNPGDQVTQNG